MTVGSNHLKIAYSAADGRYAVTVPGSSEGTLVPKTGNGGWNGTSWINLESSNSDLVNGAGQPQAAVVLDWPASSPYSYTSFGSWTGPSPMGEVRNVFAYGIPTAAADVPKVGNASYVGQIRGITNGEPPPGGSVQPILDVFGTVSLSFDFGAGTLVGSMNPEIAPVWDAVSLGTYSFRDTVYSTGSTSFSGAFNVEGSSAPSSFLGSFTGPGGAELMANWLAPYRDPVSGIWGTMGGVWIANKGN
jgi:hypothetical protein